MNGSHSPDSRPGWVIYWSSAFLVLVARARCCAVWWFMELATSAEEFSKGSVSALGPHFAFLCLSFLFPLDRTKGTDARPRPLTPTLAYGSYLPSLSNYTGGGFSMASGFYCAETNPFLHKTFLWLSPRRGFFFFLYRVLSGIKSAGTPWLLAGMVCLQHSQSRIIWCSPRSM